MKPQKIFISYSWSTPNHEEWVINLAERLVSDGVDVIIDKWDLKEGHDKYDFMESMVKSTDIDRILIISDKKYTEKADGRSGGVGTETQIISAKIYSNVSQEKFIPIIAERDENGNAFMPTYLESRIYIDLSSQSGFEENYEKLLRNIYQRPAYNKPSLGKAPSYLFEDNPITHKTSVILRSFENQINKNPKRINTIIKEFLDEFYSNLTKYSVDVKGKDNITFGKEVHDTLNLYIPLRNDFIHFFDKILKEEYDFDITIVIKFLEELPSLKEPLDDRSSWITAEFAIFKFIIHELFLYIISLGLKNENYTFLEELLYSHYFFKERHRNSEPKNFKEFYNNTDIFDEYYKKTFSKNFYSPMADFIISRIPEGFTKNNIIEADLLCHYVAQINDFYWFPLTYIYGTDLKIFERIPSSRYFEKIKGLLGVNSANELKEKLDFLEKKNAGNYHDHTRYSGSFDSVSPLFHIINKEMIATLR